MSIFESMGQHGARFSAEDYGATSAIVAVLTLLFWLVANRMSSSSEEEKSWPSYLPSPDRKGEQAGWMETIIGLTGSRAPQWVYQSFQHLPSGKTWIGRLVMTQRNSNSPAGFMVADADIAKAILTHPGTTKSKGYDEFDFICGAPNILSTNGAQWKHARKGVAPAFSSNHIKRMNRICLEQLERWRVGFLDPMAETGKPFDVGKEMINITLRVIVEAGFEYDISKEEIDMFIEAFEISSREFIIWNPLHRNFQFLFPQVWRAKRASKVLQTLAYRIMASFRAQQKGNEKSINQYEDDTIISRIVNNENYANDVERAADIIILLIAGHDTTAYSIAWTLIEVAKNKDDTVLKEYRTGAGSKQLEDLRRSEELNHIIKESMRLHPVAAMGSARQTSQQFHFKDNDGTSNIDLPKYSFVWFNLYAMFRHPKYFGHDADLFRPTRWKNPNSDMQLAHTPFSLGARNCVGQSLAKAEMGTVLSILLAAYDFAVADDGEDDFFLTLKPNGTKLIVRKLQ